MSKIEWTEKTWNPVVGCSVISPGCTNCYAMKMAARIEAADEAAYRKRVEMTVEQLSDPDAAEQTRADMNNTRVPSHYAGTTQPSKAGPVWTGKLSLAPERILTEPLRRREPTTYFVNSMSDLFHEDVPDEWILRVLDVIRMASYDGGSNIGRIGGGEGQHTFQCLTKRSARMRDVMRRLRWNGEHLHLLDEDDGRARVLLKNLWLGVSCERQQEADARIPELLSTPAAVRFVSAEPLLGPINFNTIDLPGGEFEVAPLGWKHLDRGENTDPRLDWIIVGGESGANARPMALGWAKDIVRQCKAANVPVFVKQMGAHPTNREGERCPHIKHKKGADMAEWPVDLRVREMPNAA